MTTEEEPMFDNPADQTPEPEVTGFDNPADIDGPYEIDVPFDFGGDIPWAR